MISFIKICDTVLVRKVGTFHEKGRYFKGTCNMNGRPSELFLNFQKSFLQGLQMYLIIRKKNKPLKISMILFVKICETVLVRKVGTFHEKGRYFKSTCNMNGRPSELFLNFQK